MKFLSQVITAASGSIGGTTYSRNRYGMYQRSRATPVNPNSGRQNTVRAAFAAAATAWIASLTQIQRDAWSAYAAAVPVKDKLGQDVYLNGMQWYIGASVLRAQMGVTLVHDAPIAYARALLTQTTSAYDATSDFDVTFSAADGWATATGGYLGVWASGPVSFGRNFWGGPFKFCGAVVGDDTTPPTSPASITHWYGTLPSGSKIFVRTRAITADNRTSGLVDSSFLVT